MRFVRHRRAGDDTRIKGNLAHQSEFRRIAEPGKVGYPSQLRDVLRKIGKCGAGIAKHRLRPRMAVLDIENRVIAGLL